MTRLLFLSSLLTATAISAFTPAAAQGFQPVEPGSLKADVKGIVVNLSWEWGNAGKAVCSESFEKDTFADPWSVKNTYSYDPSEGGNWMIYDFADYPDQPLNHDGTRAALLMMAASGDGDDLTTYHQDEWLIARPGTGAVYMDFWYYLYPQLLEDGAYSDFPDHYYVKISRDNGLTWKELWDGRWDMGPDDAVQQASLFLGEPSDENTLVAFNAVSAEEESLYYLWTIDDVCFYSAEEAAQRNIVTKTVKTPAPVALRADMTRFRKFIPADTSAKASRRAPESEWLDNGNTTYRVYLDDVMIGEYIKKRHYTDYSTKEPGKHVYSVVPWSEEKDIEYGKASVAVDIEEFSFLPARNIKAAYELQDDGRYNISASWEHPESDVIPDHYNIYVNGKSIGWTDTEELEMGQSGLYKGAYTFAVEACYKRPDGTAPMVYASVFPGTVPTPRNLSVTCTGNNATVVWDAPEKTDKALCGYKLYRGTELVSEGASLSFADNAVPDGLYCYSVHAVYDDGSISLPVSENTIIGSPAPMEIPYSQTFATEHTPAGWNVELVDPRESVKDMYNWRFDNWFETSFPEESGLQGCFAGISGVAAGMNLLQAYLTSPAFQIPENTKAALTFDKYFYEEKPGPSGSAQFILQTSDVSGLNWDEAMNLTDESNGKCRLDLSEYAGQTIRFRWAFMSRNSGIAAIDNVSIYDTVGIEGTETDAPTLVNVYTTDGITIAQGVSIETLKTLPSGLYITHSADGTVRKLLIRR